MKLVLCVVAAVVATAAADMGLLSLSTLKPKCPIKVEFKPMEQRIPRILAEIRCTEVKMECVQLTANVTVLIKMEGDDAWKPKDFTVPVGCVYSTHLGKESPEVENRS